MEMTAWLVLVVISIQVIVVPSWATDRLSFDVGHANTNSYSNLLNDVRNKVKDAKLNYGNTNLPVTETLTNPPHYLLIDLKSAQGNIITIALQKTSLYVVGYLDKFNGNNRAHFFKNAPPDAKTTLFPEAKNRVGINYENSYIDLERNAKLNKQQIGLGKLPLNKLINEVYGKNVNGQNEAKLMLVAIQMVSEAARFKYIEDKIKQNLDGVYNVDSKGAKLELNWSAISQAIKNSNNGNFKNQLRLVDVNGKEWLVSKVSDIVKDMALLNNEEVKKKMNMASIFKQIEAVDF